MDHVKPEDLAAYADNALGTQDLRRIDAHLVHCAECRTELVGGLRAVRDLDGTHVLTLEGGTAERKPRRNKMLVALSSLAAAAVLLIVAVPQMRTSRTSSGVERNPAEIATHAAPRIQIVIPSDGGVVKTGRPALIWNRQEGASDFQVSVTDGSGRVVWRTATADTSVLLPPEIVNAGRQQYFWYVDALQADGRVMTSGVHGFTLQR